MLNLDIVAITASREHKSSVHRVMSSSPAQARAWIERKKRWEGTVRAGSIKSAAGSGWRQIADNSERKHWRDSLQPLSLNKSE